MSSAGASGLKNPLHPFLYVFVLHELPAIGGGQTDVDRFDEASVILKVAVEDLLSKFIGLQAALGGDLRQTLFLFWLEPHVHT